MKKDSTLRVAWNSALSGGIPGMAAMATQVSTLMWMRTVMNYQYRHGGAFNEAARSLYKEGGVRRFYTGYFPALIQAPLSRFGDTAANAGMLSLLEPSGLPLAVKTLAASTTAAGFRVLLMPVDTIKTTLQVEGGKARALLWKKVAREGPSVLFHGSLAASLATLAGHYPWYTTYNYLSYYIPHTPGESMALKLGKSALIGFCASLVSDSLSNSFRVVKTARQTSAVSTTYGRVVADIVKRDGVQGG